MLKPTLLVATLVLFITPCAAQQTVAGGLPFALEQGFVVVEATIKRNVTVNVVLATGAEHSIMDPALLQKYELSAGYAADGPVTSMKPAEDRPPSSPVSPAAAASR